MLSGFSLFYHLNATLSVDQTVLIPGNLMVMKELRDDRDVPELPFLTSGMEPYIQRIYPMIVPFKDLLSADARQGVRVGTNWTR